jgi:hypothetical protein
VVNNIGFESNKIQLSEGPESLCTLQKNKKKGSFYLQHKPGLKMPLHHELIRTVASKMPSHPQIDKSKPRRKNLEVIFRKLGWKFQTKHCFETKVRNLYFTIKEFDFPYNQSKQSIQSTNKEINTINQN